MLLSEAKQKLCNSTSYEWLAVDEDGMIYAYRNKPYILGVSWHSPGPAEYIGMYTGSTPWDHSLRLSFNAHNQ